MILEAKMYLFIAMSTRVCVTKESKVTCELQPKDRTNSPGVSSDLG